MKKYKAFIRWRSKSEGGRNAPPTGPSYRGVIRFEDDRDRWPQETWSINIEIKKQFKGGKAVLGEVMFLSPEAPMAMLQPGARFELCEGPRVVAKGVVLKGSTKIPTKIGNFSLALLG